MTRYRLAIFDFDGTLADSLPWFRASFQDMITRFDLAPVRDDEVEGLRGLSAREIMARLNVSMWQLPAIVSDMRKRKLAAADETSLFSGIPAMLSDLQCLGIKTAMSVPIAKHPSGRYSDPPPPGSPASTAALRCSASTGNFDASHASLARSLRRRSASATRSATLKPRKPPAWIQVR
jgi:hypothetical protein